MSFLERLLDMDIVLDEGFSYPTPEILDCLPNRWYTLSIVRPKLYSVANADRDIQLTERALPSTTTTLNQE